MRHCQRQKSIIWLKPDYVYEYAFQIFFFSITYVDFFGIVIVEHVLALDTVAGAVA